MRDILLPRLRYPMRWLGPISVAVVAVVYRPQTSYDRFVTSIL